MYQAVKETEVIMAWTSTKDRLVCPVCKDPKESPAKKVCPACAAEAATRA